MTKRAVLLKALAATPSDVERMAKGWEAGEEIPSVSSRERACSVLLNWLLDFETHYRAQLQQVARGEGTPLPVLWPNGAAGVPNAALSELVQDFRQARLGTVAFLEGLSQKEWQRKAVHEMLGETSLRFLVQQLVEYDTQHLN